MKVLTAQEQTYLRELALRQIHISECIESLMRRPMRDIHEETGLPVWMICTMCIEAMGWVQHEMVEWLS